MITYSVPSKWCRLEDLNPQPTDYDSVALPIELSRRMIIVFLFDAGFNLFRMILDLLAFGNYLFTVSQKRHHCRFSPYCNFFGIARPIHYLVFRALIMSWVISSASCCSLSKVSSISLSKSPLTHQRFKASNPNSAVSFIR